MKESISRYRQRTDVTQESIAIDLGTNKSHISNIEAGRRKASMGIYEKAFSTADDPRFLNDLIHETTQGYGVPTPSNEVFDDHRMSLIYRAKREIHEFVEMCTNHCLDKHPNHLSEEEVEAVGRLYAEAEDALFELQGFVMKMAEDYDFIKPRQSSKNRNLRLKMQRRI